MRFTSTFVRTARVFGVLLWFSVLAIDVQAAQSSLKDYIARLDTITEQTPAIIASADVAADRLVAHPQALLNFAWDGQEAFCEEMINRAGGLAHAYPTEQRARATRATEHDVVIFSVRSWEADVATTRKQLALFREKGWPVTLIASRAGMPSDITVEHFIDNGAPDGAAVHGRINLLANVTLGWMWCTEYVAAMTRRGKMPAVLISVAYEHGPTHNRPLQSIEGRHTQVDCDTPIPAGELAAAYMTRVRKLVADLQTPETQGQIDTAAEVIATRIKAGKTVGLSGVGHIILHEMDVDNKTPFKAFRGRGGRNPFARNLRPGDLMLFIGYIGMNSKHHDYFNPIRQAKIDVVTCYVSVGDFAVNFPNPVAHVEQHWQFPDTEVELPCPPGRMAPISGLNAGLLHRMIDDAVATRLTPAAGASGYR